MTFQEREFKKLLIQEKQHCGRVQKNLQNFCTAYDCNYLKNIKLKELTMIEINKIYNEDCFITMSKMDDASIDINSTLHVGTEVIIVIPRREERYLEEKA